MVPDHVLLDSLEKTANDRRRLNEMIEHYISVASLRVGMSTSELCRVTGYSNSRVSGIVSRAEASATEHDRRPPNDPVSARSLIARELPELIALHGEADEVILKIAKIAVIERKVSANELARRTGHSRDYTQKWVKRIRAEGLPKVIVTRQRWVTPSWGDTEAVDPKYIINT